MEFSAPGRGEIVAAIGAAVMLFGLLALPWYEVGEGKIAPLMIEAGPALLAQDEPGEQVAPPGEETVPPVEVQEVPLTQGQIPESFGAWSHGGALATLANLVILAAGLFAIALAILSGIGSRLDRSGSILTWLSGLALGIVILRFIFRPEEIEDPGATPVGYEFEAGLEVGIWVTLIGALVQLAGGLIRFGRGPAPAATAPSPARGSPS
jgi:hypothetical protein